MRTTLFLLAILSAAFPSFADERLFGIACRSVHLQFPSGAVDAVYSTVTATQSAPGTYFCVLGFNRGYFGIQQLANDKKIIIFSVWDPGSQNNPNQVADEQRVKLLYKHTDVRTGRFGNEGTGGQSFYDFDWQLNTPYHFAVTSKVDGQRTVFASHFFHPEKKQWMQLITFSTPTGGRQMGGFYSFVEDFRRNRTSATLTRTARFGPAWVHQNGQWTVIDKARFTADSNPDTHINAGLAEQGTTFFLSTGGDIQNTDTKRRDTVNLPDAASHKMFEPAPPAMVPETPKAE